jgi:hypothetical protein
MTINPAAAAAESPSAVPLYADIHVLGEFGLELIAVVIGYASISSVSERASALAADQIAGAGTMAPAATPVTDFRKSRRFM